MRAFDDHSNQQSSRMSLRSSDPKSLSSVEQAGSINMVLEAEVMPGADSIEYLLGVETINVAAPISDWDNIEQPGTKADRRSGLMIDVQPGSAIADESSSVSAHNRGCNVRIEQEPLMSSECVFDVYCLFTGLR